MQIKTVFEDRKNCLILLFLITIICYCNTPFMEFVWDDVSYIGEFNNILRGFSDLFHFFKIPNFIGGPVYYRPIKEISNGIDFLIYKDNPFGHHITSILIHLANLFLVFIITERLSNRRVALFSALLFALHPIHCEAVAWIAARGDVLYSLFLFLAFYSYLSFFSSRLYKHLFLTILFYTLALFTKESSVTFIAIPLLFPFIKHTKPAKPDYLLFFLLTLVFIVYFLIRGFVVGGFVIDYYPPIAKLATIPIIFKSYLKLFFYPVDLHILYSYPKVLSEPNLDTLISSIVLLFVFTIMLYLFKKDRMFAFGLILFFLFLLLVSGIITFVRISLIADRYLYFSSFGLTLSLGILIDKTLKALKDSKLQILIISLFVFVLGLLGALTIERNRTWETNEGYLKKMISDKPDYDGAYLQLGVLYNAQGRYRESEEALQYALKYLPPDEKFRALNNLCDLFLEKNDLLQAESYCLQSLAEKPDIYKPYLLLVKIYYKQKRYEEAYYALTKGIKLANFESPEYYDSAAFLAAQLGRKDEALYFIDRAIALAPEKEEYKKNRELILDTFNQKP